MSCEICGRNSCSYSFHSIGEQERYDEQFSKHEDKISDLKDRISQLEKENEILQKLLTDEQYEEFQIRMFD